MHNNALYVFSRMPAKFIGDGGAKHLVLAEALDTLCEHPLARRAFFAKDGTLIVEYPRGYMPTALGVNYIRGEQMEMIRRAKVALDRKLERLQNGHS